MKKKVFRETLKEIKQIEGHSSLEEFLIAGMFGSTFESEKHRMKMKEDYASFEQIGEVYQELDQLEYVDLLDFKNCGEFDGKCNKKRRDIFC